MRDKKTIIYRSDWPKGRSPKLEKKLNHRHDQRMATRQINALLRGPAMVEEAI